MVMGFALCTNVVDVNSIKGREHMSSKYQMNTKS